MKPLKQRWLVRKAGNLFLSLNERLWRKMPPQLVNTRLVQRYGHLLHKMILIRNWREPNPGTFMIRNRAELAMIRKLVMQAPAGKQFRIAVLACSSGMEVYSIKWALRDLQDHVDIRLLGLDIEEPSLAVARSGRYPLKDFSWQFDRLTEDEYSQICPNDGDYACVSDALRTGIQWMHADACDRDLGEKIGQQDVVIANRFLCHMQSQQASNCLRNITKLVCPGGYLFVTGVDLVVRQNVMKEMGFSPETDNLEAMHNGDISLLGGWPWKCWGLEPFDAGRPDWVERYATVYSKPAAGSHGASRLSPAARPEDPLVESEEPA